MTKEQLQLHSEVIKWYIDNLNEGIWRKDHKTKNWHLARNPQFNIKDIYVQNDSYTKFRKALIDGKKLEYTDNNGKTWHTSPVYLDTHYTPENIRIKPEFKEGDWVRVKNSDSVEITQIKTVKHHGVILKGYDEDVYSFFFRDITLWTPKVNELCVFWTKENNDYSIKKFNYMSENGAFTTFDKSRYTQAAPLEFIETLKDEK